MMIEITAQEQARIEELLGEMTLEEKCAQLGGVKGGSLLDEEQELSQEKLQSELEFGIGQVARFVCPKGIVPAKRAAMANSIQGFLLNETRLGIPAIIHEEAIAGLICPHATLFPQPISMASTWDTDIEQQMGDIIRRQGTAIGIRQCLAPVLDLAWDPRWGRTEETFGEDPYLAAQMGAAFVRGLQSDDLRQGILCSPKHFAGFGFSEGGRHPAPVHIAPREFREKLLLPFQVALMDAGAGGVMTAMHDIDGIPCSANRELLTEILRDEWRFAGVVIADYGSITHLHSYPPADIADQYAVNRTAATPSDAAEQAMNAGVDIEPECWDNFREPLMEAVEDGRIEQEQIDQAVRRHLRAKFALGLFDHPFVEEGDSTQVFDIPEHRELAREAARRSMVLVKNDDNLLPLSKEVKTIAVIGPNADETHSLTGQYSYPAADRADANPIEMVTVLEGVRNKVSKQTEVVHAHGCAVGPAGLRVARGDIRTGVSKKGFDEAIALAQKADVVIAVVGGSSLLTCSENRDRTDINLPGVQEDLLRALHTIGKPIVAVMLNGRPLSCPWMRENIPAILEAWLPGEEGGHAVADVLFGDYNPGGKLPVSILHNAGQAPMVYNRHPWSVRTYVYTEGKPAIPFGHGLSYTEFSYEDLRISVDFPDHGKVRICCKVTNMGDRDGNEVVQLYIHDEIASLIRPVKELKGFKRITLGAGQQKKISFILPLDLLAFYDRQMRFVVEPGQFKILVGSSSKDIRLEGVFEVKEEKVIDIAQRKYACEVIEE